MSGATFSSNGVIEAAKAALVSAGLDPADYQIKSSTVAGGASVKRIHRPVNAEGKTVSVGAYLIPILEKACTDNGVEIILNTKATTIITDTTGAATGIS